MKPVRRFALLLLVPAAASAQPAAEPAQAVELLGTMGGRAAVMQLYATPQPDGGARLSGDYVMLPTLQQRFVDGERSKQLGVTFLREGASPIFYGRPPGSTLQGTWTAGVLKGTRYGPSGQQRERFEFSEQFPSMEGYSGAARCEVADERYAASLSYVIEAGRLKSMEWRSKASPSDHPCAVTGLRQVAFAGGLRFASGKCSVTLRDLGDQVRATAENCAEFCASQAYLEPMLVDRRGQCQVLRPVHGR